LARPASPVQASCRSSTSRIGEALSRPGLHRDGGVQAHIDESACSLLPCRMGIRRGNHGAFCFQSVLTEGGCSPQVAASASSIVAYRLTAPAVLQLASSRDRCRTTAFRQADQAHSAAPRVRRGPGEAGAGLASRRVGLLHRIHPHLASRLSTAAWRKAVLHRRRCRDCSRTLPGSRWTRFGGAGCVVARQTRVIGCCLAKRLCSTTVGPGCRFTALRSSAAAFRPPASSDLRAPRILAPRIASPHRCLSFKQPNGFLLHRASPSMRCPRAG
jgi:hypothetical protein